MLATLKAVFRKVVPRHAQVDGKTDRNDHNSSNGAKALLARLLLDEQAELRQIEALLIRRADLAAHTNAVHLAGRKAGGTSMVISVIEDQLALRRDALALLETRIARLQQTVNGSPCKIIDLMQAASLLRALPQ